MLKIGVVGASGYSGVELTRLTLSHPRLELRLATSNSYAGQQLSEIYPQFSGLDLKLVNNDLNQLAEHCQLVFLCLPHGRSMAFAQALRDRDIPVIDLSADFRLPDREIYRQYYEVEHTSPALLSSAIYGLPELHRERIRSASLIANPGCYATGALLGLLPLFKSGLPIEDVIVDAKSGISGAGRKPAIDTSFVEAASSMTAYKVASHRHQPEIYSQLRAISQKDFLFTFTPHLAPMKRGILSTIYVKLSSSELKRDFYQLYSDFYREEPFVRLLPPDVMPRTRSVAGTNFCQINLALDKKARRLIIVTVLDNLIKGAAGQAIENLNLTRGWDETLGLTNLAPLA